MDQHSVHLFTIMHLADTIEEHMQFVTEPMVFIVHSSICYIMGMHFILSVFSACVLPFPHLTFIGDTISAH